LGFSPYILSAPLSIYFSAPAADIATPSSQLISVIFKTQLKVPLPDITPVWRNIHHSLPHLPSGLRLPLARWYCVLSVLLYS